MVDTLNEKQKQAFRIVCHGDRPLRLIIHGFAGTGKSHLVRVLKNHLRGRAVLTAATGVAAYSISGRTVHSLFSLPVRGSYEPLKNLLAFRNRFRKIEYLIIDEFSMLSLQVLDMVRKRLQELDREDISIVLIGDLSHLQPVSGDALFSILSPSSSSSSSFSSSPSSSYTNSSSSYTNPSFPSALSEAALFYRTFDRSVVLDRCVRASKDQRFVDLLHRLRNGRSTFDDYVLLMDQMPHRVKNYSDFDDAVEIYTTNAEVDRVNVTKLRKTGAQIHTFLARYLPACKTTASACAVGLEDALSVSVGCRVMLLANLDVENGLVNGAIGRVQKIRSPPHAIEVLFEDGGGPATCAVGRISRSWTRGETIEWTCSQFPLKLAYAVTVHKCQSLTLNRVKINLGKREFCPGLTYVAFSRVRRLEDLVLASYFSFDRIGGGRGRRGRSDERRGPLWRKEEKRINDMQCFSFRKHLNKDYKKC